MTLAEVIRSRARDRADSPAVTTIARQVTFGELDRRSSQVARALAEAGVGRGDRVAFLDKNSIEFFEVLFGAAKVGAVTVALNWRLLPGELADIVVDAEAELLVVGAELADAAAPIRAAAPRLRTIVTIGAEDGSSDGTSYEGWIAGPTADDVRVQPAPSDVVLQLYTSGTTGTPKGVMLTESNLWSLMSAGGAVLDLDADSTNLVPMPLFHIGGSGYALIGFFAGCHTVLMRELDPVELLRMIEAHRATNAFVVPAVLQLALSVPSIEEIDLSSLRTIVYGASPISEDVLRRSMDAFGCRFIQVYGLTETTGTVTLLPPEDHTSSSVNARLGSAGRPIAGAAIKIIAPGEEVEVPVGDVGEIWIKSPQNMAGYWRKPDETAAALTPDGWLRTGDAGFVDDDGYLFLHDRIKDMIISGGENVYPAEVENVLMSHPDVSDVAVIAVPSERWGETVKAVVVPTPGSAPAPEELMDFARDRLAHFKCPTSVDFVDQLPRNPSGKVLKRDLRAPYWAGRSRSIS